MKEVDQRRILESIPGSLRAKDGVIIRNHEASLHITGVRTQDPELTHSEHFFLAFCTKREIIRMRSLRSVYDRLLHLRADAIVDSARKVRTFNRRREIFEQNGRQWSLTEYYQSINTDAKRYVTRLARSHQKTVRALPFGMAPIDEPNAIAFRTILGDMVIVSENLEHFYYFMNVAMYGTGLGLAPLDCLEAATIAIRIINGSETFDFDIDPRARLPENIERSIRTLTSRQIEFTFGHEFAHIILGHLDDSHTSATDRTIVYAKQAEFDADLHAIKFISNDKMARRDISLAAYDVFQFLYFLELAGQNKLGPEFSISETHPNAQLRMRHLREAIGDWKQPEMKFLNSNSQQIRKMIENVSEAVSGSMREDVLTFYGSMYLSNFTDRKLRDRFDF